MTAYTLNSCPTLELTDEQFEQVCQANLERNARGELIVMALTGGETGRYEVKRPYGKLEQCSPLRRRWAAKRAPAEGYAAI
ncbi:MAG: Uma2 family endonuclease [Hormoscilla sp. SP5CHS1]|nr:Uma2 family endonuclease [Hormoscilla sp. SP12CHS1]MBC6456201.1 Uma2 family endonuclease [Hormoscilla sp. SP5CHS1]